MKTAAITLNMWKRVDDAKGADTDSCDFSHAYWCTAKNKSCEVFVLTERPSRTWNRFKIVFTVHGETVSRSFEMSAEGECSTELLRASIRHSRKDNRDAKDNYFLRLMGIPSYCLYPPPKSITGTKRRGLPLVQKKGSLYYGNKECVYTFAINPLET